MFFGAGYPVCLCDAISSTVQHRVETLIGRVMQEFPTSHLRFLRALCSCLRFEVWDQWMGGKQELHAWAEMPLAELASLTRAAPAAEAGAGTGEEGASRSGAAGAAATQCRLLPLITEYDTGSATTASAKGPALRVDLAYHAERVLVPEPEPPEASTERAGRRGSGTVKRPGRAMPPSAAGKEELGQHAGGGHAAPQPGQPWQQQQEAQRVGAAARGSSARPKPQRGMAQQGTSALPAGAPPPAAAAAAAAAASQARSGVRFPAEHWEETNEGDDAAENNVLLANCSPARPVKAVVPAAAKGVEAVLCVEVS
jgi:hypothetical protein